MYLQIVQGRNCFLSMTSSAERIMRIWVPSNLKYSTILYLWDNTSNATWEWINLLKKENLFIYHYLCICIRIWMLIFEHWAQVDSRWWQKCKHQIPRTCKSLIQTTGYRIRHAATSVGSGPESCLSTSFSLSWVLRWRSGPKHFPGWYPGNVYYWIWIQICKV